MAQIGSDIYLLASKMRNFLNKFEPEKLCYSNESISIYKNALPRKFVTRQVDLSNKFCMALIRHSK